MQTICIEHDGGGKTRTFRALLLAYVCAAKLWEGGDVSKEGKAKNKDADKLLRPVYMVVGGSKSECVTVVSNLRSGERGAVLKLEDEPNDYNIRKGQKVELRRSAGYVVDPQLLAPDTETNQRPECHEIKLYDLVREDPGMVDPDEVAFLSLPSMAWVDGISFDVDAVIEHMRSIGHPKEDDPFIKKLIPLSPFFATRLAARSMAPIIPDLRFFVQLLAAALRGGFATMSAEAVCGRAWAYDESAGYVEYGLADVGLLPGVAFRAKHVDVEKLLIDQVKLSSCWRS
jgi:hypothetical protein